MSQAKLLSLPGRGCRHFSAGRCLVEEHRNPGLRPEYRCAVLARLGLAFDDFLTRAENLGLTEDQAARAWEARFPSLLAREGNCQDCPAGGTNTFPDCPGAAGELCLLAFPACPGRCPRFVRTDDPND